MAPSSAPSNPAIVKHDATDDGSSLASAYLIQPIENCERMFKIVNPRRGPTQSIPNLDIAANCLAADELFTKFGLQQYVGCITAEMDERPIPFVFRSEETRPLTQLYERWAPFIFSRLMREIVAPVQTYNKISRLGWDVFTNPPNKADVLRQKFAEMEQDGFSAYWRSFVGIGLRLQAESRTKTREFLFLNDDYTVVKKEVGEAERTVEVRGVGKRIGSRFRGVNNMPLPNLYKQVLDTAIHNALLHYPAFHHDMFNNALLPVEGHHVCFDVKHFERHTADAVRHRAQLLGGGYAEIGDIFSKIPYAVPTVGRRKFAFIAPNRAGGWSDQFASGDSAVAPVQKEIFTALYAQFFMETRRISEEEAIELVWKGGDKSVTIRNYGDDNSLSGDKGALNDVYLFLKQYLTVEIEQPPKFLGFVWYDDMGWRLPADSYLTKTYLNERAPYSNFRKYPNLGWVEKRKVYSRLGHPRVATEIFPYEDAVLKKLGLEWYEVEALAEQERQATNVAPGLNNPLWIMGKDYAMTAAEKLATNEFIGLNPPQTGPMIKRLLGKEWRDQLTY